jgi:hypothetical protein
MKIEASSFFGDRSRVLSNSSASRYAITIFLLFAAVFTCDVYHCIRSIWPSIFLAMATTLFTEVSAGVLEALADVVGEEPSPLRPLTRARSPLPGLGPLARLKLEVRMHLAHSRQTGLGENAARCGLLRAVDAVMPSWTPEWSTHLLREELYRWCAEAYTD